MNATDTSAAALADIKPRREVIRGKILEVLAEFPEGLTSEEITDLIPDEPYSNIQPRTCELRNAGFVRDTGLRRPNAVSGKMTIVWAAN